MRLSFASTLLQLFLCAILIGFGTQCETDSFDKVPDTEEVATTYLLLTEPTRSSTVTTCTEAETVALACATAAGKSADYLSAINGNIKPATTSTDPATLCEAEVDGEVFISPTFYTYGARSCHFKCNQEFWTQLRDAGSCTSSGVSSALNVYSQCSPLIWRTSCTNTVYSTCLTDCFSSGTATYFLPQGY
ncbi:MAG: hypothetical protein KDK33_06930 [Leptospiraceae bacterium]|nr:hypothetical protein [Leptospiraceae bacterium]